MGIYNKKLVKPKAIEYNDIPNFEGDDSCPRCNTKMNYNAALQDFKCPKCGCLVERKYVDPYWEEPEEDYDEPGPGCIACGGPYPDCKTSCNMFDD